jgi:hypothetical protein
MCGWTVLSLFKLITPTDAKIDPLLESQFAAGRLYATITSRPGQSGRADGYILEGKELEVSKHLLAARVKSYFLSKVLPQENQDRQAEARARLITVLFPSRVL